MKKLVVLLVFPILWACGDKPPATNSAAEMQQKVREFDDAAKNRADTAIGKASEVQGVLDQRAGEVKKEIEQQTK